MSWNGSKCGTLTSALFFPQKPQIHAVDNDAGNNSIVAYSLGGPGSELFSILDNGAVIFTGGSPISTLDRELTDKYELLVTARDLGNLSSSTYLTIKIEDENDNAPVFQHGPLKVLLPETARPGARVAQVQAIDIDEKGPNSKVDYTITAGECFTSRRTRESSSIVSSEKWKRETYFFYVMRESRGTRVEWKPLVPEFPLPAESRCRMWHAPDATSFRLCMCMYACLARDVLARAGSLMSASCIIVAAVIMTVIICDCVACSRRNRKHSDRSSEWRTVRCGNS